MMICNDFVAVGNIRNIAPLILTFLFPYLLQGQIIMLPCEVPADAVEGLDRKNWNGGSTVDHSEASMHNFELPMNADPCKIITGIEIELTVFGVDVSNLPPDCPVPTVYFINVTAGCPDFAPASCDVANLVDEIGGPFASQIFSYSNPPNNFTFGDVFGVDVVPIMVTSCSEGQSALTNDVILLDYQICVTVTIDDDMIDNLPDLGTDQTICPTETTTLDPGSYSSYVWNPNGEITPTIDVGPGLYTVTVTDVNGCTASDEINIQAFATSDITFNPVMPVVCDNSTISVSVNENYPMYDWSNADNGQTVDLSPGSYDVTITDNNNCTFVNSIVVGNVDPPNAGTDNMLSVCNDGTTYDLEALLSIHDAGGLWADINGSGVDVNINPTATDFSGVIPGTYDFTYTVLGATPCPDDLATISVEVAQQNNAGVPNIEQFCPDPGFLDLMSLIGDPDAGGVWTDINQIGVDLSNPFAVNFDGIPPGTYHFQYLISASGACPEQSAIITTQILDSADAGEDDVITVCEGAQVDLFTFVNGANDIGTFFDTDASGALIGSTVNTTGLAGQTFNFTYIVGSMGSPCGQDEAIFTLNIETSLSAGDGSMNTLCTEGEINLFDFLTNEDPGGLFVDINSSGGLSGNILNTENIVPGTYSYEYLIGDGMTCPQDDAQIIITFFEDPSYNFNLDEISICESFCNEVLINFTGQRPFNFPLELYTSSNSLIATNQLTVDSSTFVLTACNIGETLGFANDTLNLLTDSSWYLIIPEINDVNCTIDSIQSKDTLFITTLSNTIFQLDTTACISDTLDINGVLFFDGNETFSDTISGMNCDSIVTINVEFLELDTVDITETICLGDSTFILGTWYSESFPSDEFSTMNATGCDSLIRVNVSFFPPADTLLNVMLCSGDSLIVNGAVFNSDIPMGVVTLFNQAQNGCDSIISVMLEFSDDIMTTIDDTLCTNEFIEVGGIIFDINNPSDQITLTGSGCDTIVDISLSFYDVADTLINGFFCPDDSIEVFGEFYHINNPVGSDTLFGASQFGCDSIINIDLSFYDVADSLISGMFCSNDTIIVNNVIYDINNPMGTQTLIGESQFGCDSIVTVDMQFFTEIVEDFNTSICDNESIEINGTSYNAANTSGTELLMAANGCDSTVNISLTILPSYNQVVQDSICQGDSIFLEGAWQFSAGTYIDLFTSTDMCDSIITTELSIFSCTVDVTLNSVDNNCALGNEGSITLDIGSTIDLPFTVTWQGVNNGVNGTLTIDTDPNQITIENLISDMYEIVILDSQGQPIYQNSIDVIDTNPALDGNWVVVDSILCYAETGSIEFQVTGGMAPYSYNWDPTTVGDVSLAQDVTAGEYQLTVTDQNDCVLNTSFVFTEPDFLTANFAWLSLSCEGSNDGEITISDITGGIEPINIFFNNQPIDSLNITGLDTGTYVIELVDANNCRTSTTITLINPDNPQLGTYSENYQINEGDSVILIGTVIDTNFTFSWVDSDGSLSCIDCPNPVAKPTSSTTYELTISDSAGCTQMIVISVDVTPAPVVNIHPNVFSPNGDNFNDEFIFRLNDTDVVGLTMRIYDRWGNLMHLAQSASNEVSWDGTKEGSRLSLGIYVYQVIILKEDGSSEVKFGDVTLIE
ncbi:MAG: gliding motility-associated C-terminal domain-containing protein [Bacteroidota bacterium]